MIFTAMMFLCISIVKGQQRLSYSYDAAGNRTSRTVVVGAQNLSVDTQNEPSISYIDSIGGNEVLITSESGASRLLFEFKKYKSTTKGKYSISDTNGKVLTGRNLLAKTTAVELDALPIGNYTLKLFLDNHTSTWNLQKL